MIRTIHRGSTQIGGSCVELRSACGARILLDVGMPLTQCDGSEWPRGTMTRPGAELRRERVLPDIEGLYGDSTPAVSALVLSHVYLDHYGLAHHVHPDVPVNGSRKKGTGLHLGSQGLNSWMGDFKSWRQGGHPEIAWQGRLPIGILQ
jgi:hypothetical protein